MKDFSNIDIYNTLGVSNDSSLKTIEQRIKKFEELVKRNPTEESQRILFAVKQKYEKMLEEKKEADYNADVFLRMTNENHNRKQKEEKTQEINRYLESITSENHNKKHNSYKLQQSDNKPKQAKSVKIKTKVIKIIAGVMVGVCAFGLIKVGANNLKKIDNENNVCVEYTVQQGDTKERLSGLFKEYGVSYLEVSGAYRDADYIYEGDVVIGRTTKAIADDLVAKGLARIISIDEAVELLGENNALIGEFRAYANGNSDMVFFVPEQKTMA